MGRMSAFLNLCKVIDVVVDRYFMSKDTSDSDSS